MMTDNMRQVERDAEWLVERANSTDPDTALTGESPLSLEVSGKYVNVLFSTGGPHLEMLTEYIDSEDAELWFEQEPRGAWVTFMDWGVREDVYIGPARAGEIMRALARDPEELEEVTGG